MIVRMLTVRVVPRRGSLLRAVLATLEIMTGTLLAHAWAGGALPSPAWIALMGVLVAGGTLLVHRGRVPLAVAVPTLAVVQLLLHCWLVALVPTASMPGMSMSGMSHGAGGHGLGELGLSAPMLLAHLVSAALTALVWSVRRRAVEVLLTWARAPRVPVPSFQPVVGLLVPSYVVVEGLLCIAPRRGPPALPALA